MPSDFDVAVVGAGPAGAATARHLARRGCRVVLIERSRFETPRVGESLAPGVQPLLRELGSWSEFLALRPLPSHGTRSAWGEALPQVHTHLLSAWGCGWHVDRLAFDRMLAQAARAAGATLLCGTRLVRCEGSATGWELTLDGREPFRLRARLMIEASGRAARLAPWLGARRLLLDNLVAVAAQLTRTDTAREGHVTVETTADGWWYTAPVPDGRLVVMLMTDSDLCGRANLGGYPAWHARLAATGITRERAAGGVPSWGPRVFAAVSQRLRRGEQRASWLAVGDAALAVDPLSGSGVVRALRSARAGAEAALAWLEGGASDAIAAYEAELDRACTTYLHERALYYGLERRWPESDFWQRRAAALAHLAQG